MHKTAFIFQTIMDGYDSIEETTKRELVVSNFERQILALKRMVVDKNAIDTL
jgi:hypothetical protein